jgi:hypothetical protein
MNAFTDDELKRLKERIDFVGLKDDEINALLARLEAAEKFCDAWQCECSQACDTCTEALNAWRKACGKAAGK